jgi:hypothetical protein
MITHQANVLFLLASLPLAGLLLRRARTIL